MNFTVNKTKEYEKFNQFGVNNTGNTLEML